MAARRPASLFATVGCVVLLGWAALGLTVAALPGISADSAWAVLAAAVVLGLLGAALRPLLVMLLTRIGWLGVCAGWLVGEALLLAAALTVTPGIRADGFWDAFWAAWLYAALTSIGLWAVTAGQPGVVTRHLLRVNRRFRRSAPPSDVPGVVMIQIDGLSAPLARWSIQAGAMPTLGRWLRSGSHRLTEWHARLPATTPASQAGLLHGASDRIPAFRWYEKDSGRLVVTNRPRDSALVESRLSDAHGLLADGGVSVSNVFSGDAPTSVLTMSTAGARPGAGGPPRYLAAYLLDPFGLTRSLVLTVGEIVKELHQARRQRLRRVEPRISRTGPYVLLRGLTNVLLRQLNLAVVAEQIMRGAPAVYCDFVDYDEIAHHAGPARPEALAALEGIDAALGILEEVAGSAPRPYEFVVLSDHGQSQGATFSRRYGLRLEELVRRCTAGTGQDAVAADGDDEQKGRARTLGAGLLPRSGSPAPDGSPAASGADIVVAASGNLALLYLTALPGRVPVEQIEERYPALLTGLIEHPGIGWVLVRSRRYGPVVLGRAGRNLLERGRVEGEDPLAGFGPYAADDLRRYDGLEHVGDIVVNSAVWPETGEVAAFEELIGCHGGMGGWQDRALLIHPAGWPAGEGLIGADAVHRRLRCWMQELRPVAVLTPPG
ncbi:phage holin family protein [Actinoplanes sp. NPDC049316]|uniref:phage holin family protein n=1 Tax=Actinoplanes sp. NPDC049316 TaxID=3154727 RepID=UPI003445374E